MYQILGTYLLNYIVIVFLSSVLVFLLVKNPRVIRLFKLIAYFTLVVTLSILLFGVNATLLIKIDAIFFVSLVTTMIIFNFKK
jgi:hypothetical protein